MQRRFVPALLLAQVCQVEVGFDVFQLECERALIACPGGLAPALVVVDSGEVAVRVREARVGFDGALVGCDRLGLCLGLTVQTPVRIPPSGRIGSRAMTSGRPNSSTGVSV